MSKLRLFFALLSMVGWVFSGVFTSPVMAAESCLGARGIDFVDINPETELAEGIRGQQFSFKLDGLPNDLPQVELRTPGYAQPLDSSSSNSSGEAEFTFRIPLDFAQHATLPYITLELHGLTGSPAVCELWDNMIVQPSDQVSCSGSNIKISQIRNGQSCFWNDFNGCIESNGIILVSVSGVTVGPDPYTGTLQVKINNANPEQQVINVSDGTSIPIAFALPPASIGSPNVSIEYDNFGSFIDICNREIEIIAAGSCGVNACPTEEEDEPEVGEGEDSDPFLLCNQLPEGTPEKADCIKCATGGGGEEVAGADESRQGIWTALGCINRDPQNIIERFIFLGLSMGGGIALLMILAAGFMFSTSQGNPKQVESAKELITAAVTGLLFIIFSVVMLQFIGFSVLKIPGFGG
jgi:hypothetical protein